MMGPPLPVGQFVVQLIGIVLALVLSGVGLAFYLQFMGVLRKAERRRADKSAPEDQGD